MKEVLFFCVLRNYRWKRNQWSQRQRKKTGTNRKGKRKRGDMEKEEERNPYP